MAARFSAGDMVQTPFGKGVVREIRNGNRLMVEVQGAALVLKDSDITAVTPPRTRAREPRASERVPQRARSKSESRRMSAEIDLHGLTVEEALERVEQALSEAMLADVSELRLIHGRSGGRLRGAVQRRLRETPSVRNFRLDPHNDGVTIVTL